MSRSNITNAIFCRIHEGELYGIGAFPRVFRDKETLTCYVPCRFYWFSLGLGQHSLYYSWSSTLCRVPVAKFASNAAGYIRTVRWTRQFSLNRALFAIIKKKGNLCPSLVRQPRRDVESRELRIHAFRSAQILCIFLHDFCIPRYFARSENSIVSIETRIEIQTNRFRCILQWRPCKR